MSSTADNKPFLSRSSTGPVVVRNGKLDRVPTEDEVDYEMLSPSQFFGTHINTLPLANNVQAARLFYANRFMNQAVPLLNREVPLVQNEDDETGKSYDEKLGSLVGAKFADDDGVVDSVTEDTITWTDSKGEKKTVDYVQSFPFNRKTSLEYTVKVKPGDKLVKGQPILTTNFTDDKGAMAMGVNARVGLAAYKGFSYDDSTVISESFAKRLASQHMYKQDMDYKDGVEGGRDKWLSLFPKEFKQEELQHIDEDGVAQPGTIVQPGQPLILASKPKNISSTNRTLGKLHALMKGARSDASVLWDGEEPAEVVDVHKTAKGVRMNVRTMYTVKEGDKVVTRNGHKGVVSKVLPDDQMPRTIDGAPFDILTNQLGLPSRVNNAMPLELQLGKIARKQGKPIVVSAFGKPGENRTKIVKQMLAEHGLPEKEEVFDPVENRVLEQPITTGYGYIMKLHHMGSAKISHRGVGSYDLNQQPTRGSGEMAKAKRASGLEVNALQSSGAYNNVREFSTLRGQRCFDPETEVLTHRGWVRWPEVSKTDRLYTRSKDDEMTAWFEVPEALVSYDFSGELLGYEGRHLDWLVTPDHSFWGVPCYISRNKPWRNKRLFTAAHAYGRDGSVDAFGAIYQGTIPLTHRVRFAAADAPSAKRQVKELDMSITDYCELIGWWGSEGCASVDKEGRGEINISQSLKANPTPFARVEDLLRRIGFTGITYKKVSPGSHACTSSVVKTNRPEIGSVVGMRVRSRPLAEHLLRHGNRSWNKRLPDLVFEAPLESRLALLDAYTEGDGCIRKNVSSMHRFIVTTSHAMASDLQRLAISCGLGAWLGDATRKISKRPIYRVIISDNLTEMCFRRKPASRFKGHYKLPYEGKVYCATMRTGLLFVRRNGKAQWSGNCDQYWRDLSMGLSPKEPGRPFVFDKFKAILAGTGYNTRKIASSDPRSDLQQLVPFTDADLDKLNPIEVKKPDIVDLKDPQLTPIKEGLFDPAFLENGWGYIRLPHKMLNPAYEKAAISLLGLKKKDFDAIVAGEMELPEHLR